MRLKSGIWVAAYVRRCYIEGAFAAVRRRGAEEAGVIYIKISRLDGTSKLYGPAPQAAFDDANPAGRLFSVILGRDAAVAEPDVEARLAREIKYDPDIWIIEVEDRAGRDFLDDAVV
jgi:hypothetical protein